MATADSKLADAGQRLLDASNMANMRQSAFIAMRAKPPAATFSSKALSFYSNEQASGLK